jgi:hypothetical protein
MADTENNQSNPQAKPRTRRSALADISNTIANSFSNLIPSKRTTKKRKLVRMIFCWIHLFSDCELF